MEPLKTPPFISSPANKPETVTVYVRPKTILSILLAAIAVLLSLNLLGIYLSLYTDIAFSKTHRLIDFNQEQNIPSFYSSLVIFLCSCSLFVISALRKKTGKDFWPWLGLGFIFLFLSVDEAASIHEIFVGITKRTFNLSGYFYFAWVLPYGLAVAALAVLYFPFLKNLPGHTRLLFLVSGAIYVGSAIGLEMIAGNSLENDVTLGQYAAFYTVEELLEMLGIALFLYALLDYLSKNFDFNLRVGK